MNDIAKITTFAKRYAEAWCSQNPESVAAFFAENGSLTSTTDRALSDARRSLTRRKDS
jgi:hypothetical protein